MTYDSSNIRASFYCPGVAFAKFEKPLSLIPVRRLIQSWKSRTVVFRIWPYCIKKSKAISPVGGIGMLRMGISRTAIARLDLAILLGRESIFVST